MKRNVFGLFGAVAVLLTATLVLTLSRATLSESNGNLKCYDLEGGIAKCSTLNRPSLFEERVSAMRD
jgi:hypothetical protein